MVSNFDDEMNHILFIFLSNHYAVLNFCFANVDCGKHGRCVNTLSGFKCSCSFLYDGLRCERSKIYFFEKRNQINEM
jgi:hypothetical protein